MKPSKKSVGTPVDVGPRYSKKVLYGLAKLVDKEKDQAETISSHDDIERFLSSR